MALLWLHVPVLVAIGLSGELPPLHVAAETSVLAVASLVAGYAGLSRSARMASTSLGIVTASAVLVHFSGGYVEMHFHFFVVVVKSFNDTFGHSAGDAVLAAVGRAVLEYVRDEDIACRMGGEELVVILPDCSGETAVARAEELRTIIRSLAVEFHGQALGRVTVSLGVAIFPIHGTTTEALMVAADAALYGAKAQGRDRTLVHAP